MKKREKTDIYQFLMRMKLSSQRNIKECRDRQGWAGDEDGEVGVGVGGVRRCEGGDGEE